MSVQATSFIANLLSLLSVGRYNICFNFSSWLRLVGPFSLCRNDAFGLAELDTAHANSWNEKQMQTIVNECNQNDYVYDFPISGGK